MRQHGGDDSLGILRHVVGMIDREAECAGFEFFEDVKWIWDGGGTMLVGGDGTRFEVLGFLAPAVPAALERAGLCSKSARGNDGVGDGFAGTVGDAEDGLWGFRRGEE
ncbi:MAG: hypothetical protein JWO95_3358 [Verrucomicrobiales bacterium]|nr:hypothetical protein [Verrucomicrobiales bacterium]